MALNIGEFIRLNYTGMVDGEVFDTTVEEKAKEAGIDNPSAEYGPIVIQIGRGHVTAGLDEALIGREANDEGDVEVPPEKGFGAYDRDQVEAIPVKKFKNKPQVGARVQIENREGVVRDIIGGRAVIDYNHNLAGQTLQYHYTIEGLVEDPIEKIRGLIQLYAGKSMEVVLEDGVLTLALPTAITYDRRWLLWRGTIVRDIFETVADVKEIRLIESVKRPEAVPEGAAPAEELEPAPEQA